MTRGIRQLLSSVSFIISATIWPTASTWLSEGSSKARLSTSTVVVALVAGLALGVATGCGGSNQPGDGKGAQEAALRVEGSVQTLRSLLKARGVRLDGSAGSMQTAWAAFKQFAALPIAESDIISEVEGDGFLFQWGAYDRLFGRRERTFQVEFTRQYVLRNEDIQQVHLVVNFARAPLDLPSNNNGDWSFDLPGADRAARLEVWIDEVESSEVYRAAVRARPLAYDVWQDSAE